eukprot:CAMPEP_0201120962 /NCGR_PEP_ID=MMETSP0850-20130426/4930_1 /ASSEMBLY_ACC=CAM_ASM_000622 /TAXON_ID=183588 /ORGANISM="Pseudo-nitzschia fraudulenta, Strain WWA7" /LENGTH=63 /DNA_ID=CAMNT_0047387267 /DNA_START=326 /DNA_END=514 /DNA_ORIENTATION=-
MASVTVRVDTPDVVFAMTASESALMSTKNNPSSDEMSDGNSQPHSSPECPYGSSDVGPYATVW